LKKESKDPLGDRLAGVQLAIFEIVWPAIVWITHIFVRRSGSTLFLHVQTERGPSSEEWEDCQRLLGEILDAACEDLSVRYEIARGTKPPSPDGYIEIMSDHLFKRIAADVAPWRLSAGR
jgi:hypothetical protein